MNVGRLSRTYDEYHTVLFEIKYNITSKIQKICNCSVSGCKNYVITGYMFVYAMYDKQAYVLNKNGRGDRAALT